MLLQGDKSCPALNAIASFRPGRFVLLLQRIHLDLRLLHADAGLQPGHCTPEVAFLIAQFLFWIQRQGYQHIEAIKEAEVRRQNANDGEGGVVESNATAYDVTLAAKPLLPQTMTHDGHTSATR